MCGAGLLRFTSAAGVNVCARGLRGWEAGGGGVAVSLVSFPPEEDERAGRGRVLAHW